MVSRCGGLMPVRAETVKRWTAMLFAICLLFLSACSGVGLNPPDETNGREDTAHIIIGKPEAIFKALKAIEEDDFLSYRGRMNAEAGKMRFAGRERLSPRGDVEVLITLRRARGTNEKGEKVEGYALSIRTSGVGGRHAVDRIRDSFLKDTDFYNLSAVKVHDMVTKEFDPKEEDEKKGVRVGSGFVLGGLPLVVTNYHVVTEDKEVDIIFQDSAPIRGRVMKRDESNDIAIIEFKDERKVHLGFRLFPSEKVIAGQEVFAIGYPLGETLGENAGITKGVVSSTVGIYNDSRHFRISAAVNPGNSGGPLLDAHGRVIGVVSHRLSALNMIKQTGQIPEGTNFAIKSALLLSLYPRLATIVDDREAPPITADKIFATYSKAVVMIRTLVEDKGKEGGRK